MNGFQNNTFNDYSIRYTIEKFPIYRHLPGSTPHPFSDPKGHSYNVKERIIVPLTNDNWKNQTDYLFGVDLFNFGFWWEAHEMFENYWKISLEPNPIKKFLQGLIQICAALLKWLQNNLIGMIKLSTKGIANINSNTNYSYLLGINLELFTIKLKDFFCNEFKINNELPKIVLFMDK